MRFSKMKKLNVIELLFLLIRVTLCLCFGIYLGKWATESLGAWTGIFVFIITILIIWRVVNTLFLYLGSIPAELPDCANINCSKKEYQLTSLKKMVKFRCCCSQRYIYAKRCFMKVSDDGSHIPYKKFSLLQNRWVNDDY